MIDLLVDDCGWFLFADRVVKFIAIFLSSFPHQMTFVDVILYIGTFVFAVTGALKARTHQMDILGASVLAFVTAYGGGTLRDLLIGIRVGWMNDPSPWMIVAAAAVVVF